MFVFELRNDKGNSLNRRNMQELLNVLLHPKEMLLIKGYGKHFCTGLDKDELSFELLELYEELIVKLYTYPYATLCFVNGTCIGGALPMVCACDIRIAKDTAVFFTPTQSLGVPYPSKAMEVMLRLLGRRVVQELVYLGRKLSTSEALEVGLVQRSFSDEEEAMEYLNGLSDMLQNQAFLENKRNINGKL